MRRNISSIGSRRIKRSLQRHGGLQIKFFSEIKKKIKLFLNSLWESVLSKRLNGEVILKACHSKYLIDRSCYKLAVIVFEIHLTRPPSRPAAYRPFKILNISSTNAGISCSFFQPVHAYSRSQVAHHRAWVACDTTIRFSNFAFCFASVRGFSFNTDFGR